MLWIVWAACKPYIETQLVPPFALRYDTDGYYTPRDGKEYAHTGVMGYARIRWVDMDAYDAVAAGRGNSPAGGNGGLNDDVTAKLAQLLIGLDLTPHQMQQLQDGLGDSGLLDRK